MKPSLRFIEPIINLILEIFFPSSCLGCKTKGEILCSSCIIKIKRTEKETAGNIIAVFQYHDLLIKKAIWDLKYHHRPSLGKRLGEILYEELLEDISDLKIYTAGAPIIVIPIPISKKRKRKRGYNQAKKIAKGFCGKGERENFLLKTNIVIKKIKTTPQARITNRSRRLKNIKGSFKIKNKELVQGQTIIIVDDVTTTGGTINEVINILKKAGAKKVVGFAVAH